MRKLWSMTKSYGVGDVAVAYCTSNFTTKTAYVLGFAAMTSTSVSNREFADYVE